MDHSFSRTKSGLIEAVYSEQPDSFLTSQDPQPSQKNSLSRATVKSTKDTIEEAAWSMSGVHHTTVLKGNISEAKDTAASVHKNAMSWAVWRGHKEKKSVSFAAVMPAASSQSALGFSCSAASSQLRTTSVPDVVGPGPSPRNPYQNVSTALDALCASSMRFLTPQPFGKGGFSKTKMTNSQVDFCGQTSSAVKPNALRQTYSPSDRLAVKGPGRRREQVVQSEKDRNLEGSPKHASNCTSFCSRIHFDIPPSPVRSILFLVKSLSISLEDLKTNPATLHVSTLRLAIASVKKSKSTNHRRASRCRKSGGLSYCKDLQSKERSHKVKQIAPAHRANGADSVPQCHSAASGLLTFSGPSPRYIKTSRQKGNADEEALATHKNSERRLHTDAGSRDKLIGEEEEERVEECRATPNREASLNTYKTCYYHSQLKEGTVDGAAKSLSLQEALELLRPDFISRSQGRVKKLEQRARTRRAHCDSGPCLVHGLGEDRGKHRRNCTTPDPLSDNLFKPRDRTISGREMQLRSRRIYNKLPEVTKRRQEEKRRAVSQTNRLRAEVYKKKLLDQVLQR